MRAMHQMLLAQNKWALELRWQEKWQVAGGNRNGWGCRIQKQRRQNHRKKMMTKDVHFCMPRMASCKLPSGPRRARAGAMMDTLMAKTTACSHA